MLLVETKFATDRDWNIRAALKKSVPYYAAFKVMPDCVARSRTTKDACLLRGKSVQPGGGGPTIEPSLDDTHLGSEIVGLEFAPGNFDSVIVDTAELLGECGLQFPALTT